MECLPGAPLTRPSRPVRLTNPRPRMRIIRHDLTPPEQAKLKLMRVFAFLIGWIALPVTITVAMWREWVPNELGVPVCLFAPVAPFLWIHVYRRLLLLDAAGALHGVVVASRSVNCPPELWRHIVRVAAHASKYGWIRGTSESPAGRFAESVLSRLQDDPREAERAHAVEWHEERAVLVWHRPALQGSHPQESLYALWIWDGSRGEGDLAGRIAAATSEHRADPERMRNLVEAAGMAVDRRFPAVLFRPTVLVVGGSPQMRPALLQLDVEMVLQYEHPGTLWVGSLAMAEHTPDAPGRITAAIEEALRHPRSQLV